MTLCQNFALTVSRCHYGKFTDISLSEAPAQPAPRSPPTAKPHVRPSTLLDHVVQWSLLWIYMTAKVAQCVAADSVVMKRGSNHSNKPLKALKAEDKQSSLASVWELGECSGCGSFTEAFCIPKKWIIVPRAFELLMFHQYNAARWGLPLICPSNNHKALRYENQNQNQTNNNNKNPWLVWLNVTENQ